MTSDYKTMTSIEPGWQWLEIDSKLMGKQVLEQPVLKQSKYTPNSTISTKDVKYATADIGNFYTNSKLESSEYMKIHLSLIPQEIIDEYDVMQYIETDAYVYV